MSRRILALLVLACCLYGFIFGLGTEAFSRKTADQLTQSKELYLNLIKLSLTDMIYEHNPRVRQLRENGRDWPKRAFTMIGLKRMDNLRYCIEDVLANKVPGDFIEAGAWRGGATIFMRAILKAHDIKNRVVWVADSFEGLPPSNPEKYTVDKRRPEWYESKILAVSLEEVKENFDRYDLLDDQVRFLKGWFKDTLPTAPIEQLAVARLDGDMYESTMDSLVHLYPKISIGGYLIIDDYYSLEPTRKAVDDYRKQHNITEKIIRVDNHAGYWKKSYAF